MKGGKVFPMPQKVVILAPLPHCGNFALNRHFESSPLPFSTLPSLPLFHAALPRTLHSFFPPGLFPTDRTHAMKLYLDSHTNTHVVTGYGDDHVMIDKERYEGNLLLTANRIVTGWAPAAGGDLAGLTEADLAETAGLGAQILIVGTGRRQRFPQPQLLRPLVEARIGFEFMDFAAACRTYNILVGEGRAVALALLHERAA